MPVKVAVLMSGQGSLLPAICDRVPVALSIADRLCPAIRAARRLRIPGEIVARDDFSPAFEDKRRGYTLRVLRTLKLYEIEFVAMAGFKTVLAPEFFEHYPNRVLNVHPSLLPDFKGAHAVRDTLSAGVAWTGSTVHVATAEVDSGEILAQSKVPVLQEDTVETLRERLIEAEKNLYPRAMQTYLRSLFPA